MFDGCNKGMNMLKKAIFTLIITLLCSNTVFADFKYTEERVNKMNMPGMGMMGGNMGMMEGMPPGLMNKMMGGMMQPQLDKTTTFIKGNKKREDRMKDNTSTITLCDKKQMIILHHQNKSYVIEDMNQQLRQMEAMCNQPIDPPEFNTEIPKTPYINNTQESQGDLVIKTTIIDTKEDEMVGSLLARHYIKTVDISGAPNCMPSMNQREDLWAANIKPETLECPMFSQFTGCKNMPFMRKMPQNSNCFKTAKHINEGLQNIPGFVVKKVMTMDMGSMMQGMGGMNNDMQGGIPPMMGGKMKVEDTTIFTNLSNDPLPDSLFEIPEGYTLNNNLNRHHEGF